MAEAVAAVGLAAAILQLADFSARCLVKGFEVYKSADGAAKGVADIIFVTDHMQRVCDELKTSQHEHAIQATHDLSLAELALRELAETCSTLSLEFLAKLKTLKVEGRQSAWASLRKGLRTVWSKEKIDQMHAQLRDVQSQLHLRVLLDLRYGLHALSVNLHVVALIDISWQIPYHPNEPYAVHKTEKSCWPTRHCSTSAGR